MFDPHLAIRSRFAAIRLRRWLVVGLCWAVCLAGWPAVLLMPDLYQATAVISVDADTLLAPLLRNLTVDNDPQHRLLTVQQNLLGRASLKKAAAAAGIAVVGNEGRFYDGLAHRIKVTLKSADLFTVAYAAADPDEAMRLVSALTAQLVEGSDQSAEMAEAGAFIENQIAEYEVRLHATEQRVAEFKAGHISELASGGTDFSGRLEAARQARQAAEAEVASARAARDRWREQMRGIPASVDPVTGATGDTRLGELERALADLRTRYTDKHPDVVAAARAVEEMRARIAAGDEHDRPTAGPRQSNPVYAQAVMRVIEAEQAADAAARRLSQAEAEEKRLSALAASAPAVEVEFDDLSREYGVQRHEYEELLARRDQARMAVAMAGSAGGSRFRVVEPPLAAPAPAGPDRLLLLAAVLAAGLAAGIGGALLLHHIDDPVTSAAGLAASFPYPVLGGVALVPPAAGNTRGKLGMLAIAVAGLGLLAAFGVAVAIELGRHHA